MFKFIIKTRRGRLNLADTQAVWSRFAKYARPHRWRLLAAFLAAIATIGTQLMSPWPIKIIFDRVLTHKMSKSWLRSAIDWLSLEPGAILFWVCVAILAIAVLDAVSAYFRDILLAQTGQRVVGKIRQDLFAHLQTLSPAVFERRRTGDLLMRLTGDIVMLRQMLVSALVTGGQSILLIVVMVVAMFWLNPMLALLGVTTVPLTAWAGWRISKQIRAATNSAREKESVVASIAHDVLGAMAIVQAFNREQLEHKRFSRQNRSSIRASLRTTRLESKLNRIVSFGSAAAMCAILYFGVRSVLHEVMTAGDLLVFISYLRALNKPLRHSAKLAGQLAKSTSCGQRVAEVFAIPASVTSSDDAVQLDRIRGDVELDHVTFSYDGITEALSDVSVRVRAGERVALVGHTGAGKTTIAKLLLRFEDPEFGSVLFDGFDIRYATLESMRRQIGWVHQDTVLFGMTVEENITLGRPDADPELVREVARRVRAHEFIDQLPAGYATVLGQGGSTLSGGQRQRLALARALLREPPVLILDEPATGLDATTRQAVEQAWLSDANKATTIVICHRLSSMHRFDRILVLNHGKLVEQGTHQELVARGGMYAAMYAIGPEANRPGLISERAAC